MDRHAVIDEKGVVVNVIVWDGKANWSPPTGHRTVPHEDVARGDIWHEELQEFVRPLSILKAPEDEISIAQRKEVYEKSKVLLKSNFLIINDHGHPEL